MGADEVNTFQTLSAILFLYRFVLEDPLPWLDGVVRARRTERIPVVMTPEEARLVIDEVQGRVSAGRCSCSMDRVYAYWNV